MPKVKTRQGQPERGRSALEDEMTDMAEVAYKMCCKASRRGISASFVLSAHDPLGESNFTSAGFSGDVYSIIGATRVAVKRWESD